MSFILKAVKSDEKTRNPVYIPDSNHRQRIATTAIDFSMDMVEEFMMPCYDRIAAFAAENRIPIVSVDSDGLVDELVPVMMRHGVNAFLPFEVQADNDICEYRRQFPGLGIIGGLDKNALSDTAPDEAMHRELDRAERMLAEGGYIPGCDHLIPPNVSWKKWSAFNDALKN